MRQINHDDSIKILHVAGLHIGSAMAIGKRVGRDKDLTAATWLALENIIDLALEKNVDVVTIGGDVFDKIDQNNPLPRTKLIRYLSKLGEIPVALVRGNHDHLSPSVPLIPWPVNVKELTKSDPTLDLGRLCIHGISYNREKQKDDLVPKYPDPIDGRVNIGLLHANVGGQQGHDPYSPTDVETLTAKGYQAWLLGHIHQRQVLEENPLIIYPGNIQGRHSGETGPRTVEIVTVMEDEIAITESHHVHSVLWDQIILDLSKIVDEDEMLNLIDQRIDDKISELKSERGLILRLRMTGQSQMHEKLSSSRYSKDHDEITDLVQEHVHVSRGFATDDPFILVDKVHVNTTLEYDIETLCKLDDNVLGVVARMLDDKILFSEAIDKLRNLGIIDEKVLDKDGKEMWEQAIHSALGRIRGRTQ